MLKTLFIRYGALVVVLGFVIKMLGTNLHYGSELLHVDIDSERNSYKGAIHWLENKNFLTNFGLPTYGKSNKDSGSEIIANADIYTHYFPGPDYVIAAFIKLTGNQNLFWMRFIPLLHVVLASLLLFLSLGRLFFSKIPWFVSIALACVLFSPGMRPWVLSLHGHAYTSSYILIGLYIGLSHFTATNKVRKLHYWVLFIIGLFSNYMLLTAAFVVCFAPGIGRMFVWNRSMLRDQILLLLATGMGLVTAFGVHFLQIVGKFGFQEALKDQLETMTVRGGKHLTDTTRVMLLGQYSNHAFTFWGLSCIQILFIGALAAYCTHLTKKKYRLLLPNQAFALSIASCVSSYCWIMAMAGHSKEHVHVNPRIFFLPYTIGIILIGIVLAQYKAQVKREPYQEHPTKI